MPQALDKQCFPGRSNLGPIGSEWFQMGQIREFSRSDFSTFQLCEPKCTEIWSEKVLNLSNLRRGQSLRAKKCTGIWSSKKSRICHIWGQSDPLWAHITSLMLSSSLLPHIDTSHPWPQWHDLKSPCDLSLAIDLWLCLTCARDTSSTNNGGETGNPMQM